MAYELIALAGPGHVVGARYDADASALEIEYDDGSTYVYEGVPSRVVDGLRTAPSAGRYVAQTVKFYPYRRV